MAGIAVNSTGLSTPTSAVAVVTAPSAMYRKALELTPFALEGLFQEVFTWGSLIALAVPLVLGIAIWIVFYVVLKNQTFERKDKWWLAVFTMFFVLLGFVSLTSFFVSLIGLLGAGEMLQDFKERQFEACSEAVNDTRWDSQERDLHLFYTGSIGVVLMCMFLFPLFWFIAVILGSTDKLSREKKKVIFVGLVVLSPFFLLVALLINSTCRASYILWDLEALRVDAGCTKIFLPKELSDVFTPLRLMFWTFAFVFGYALESFIILGLYCALERGRCCARPACCRRKEVDDEEELEIDMRRGRCSRCWRHTLRLISRVVPLPRMRNVQARGWGKVDDVYARWEEWMNKQLARQFLGEDISDGSSSDSSMGSNGSDDELVSTALFRPRPPQRVRAFWDKKNAWYMARVRAATSRGYDITYLQAKSGGSGERYEFEELGRESGVPIERIRRLHRFRRGEKVRCNIRNSPSVKSRRQKSARENDVDVGQGGMWQPGEIMLLNKNGTYLVKMEHGTEENIDEMRIEPIAAGSEGFSQTLHCNIFDFGFGELPGGVISRGGSVELVTGRLGSTSLVAARESSLSVPLQDLHPAQGNTVINNYTLMMDLKLPDVPPGCSLPLVRTGGEACILAVAQGPPDALGGEGFADQLAAMPPSPANSDLRTLGDADALEDPDVPLERTTPGAPLGDRSPREQDDKVFPAAGLQILVGEAESGPSLQVQRWQHIAVAVDGLAKTALIYVNGKEASSGPVQLETAGGGRTKSAFSVDPSLPLVLLGGIAGPTVLRRFEFHSCLLSQAEVERRCVESCRIRKKRQPPKPWALADLWKRARPVYREPTFLAECLDPFLGNSVEGSGDFWRAARLLVHTLREIAQLNPGARKDNEIPVPPGVLQPFCRLVDLAKHMAPLQHQDSSVRIHALPRFLVQLGKQRAALTGNEPLLVPLLLREKSGLEAAILVLQRTGVAVPPLTGTYRIVICSAGAAESTRWHPHTFDPKLRVKSALVLEGVSATTIEDDAWWFTMYTALLNSQRPGSELLFDIFLPAVIGEPVEGRLATRSDTGDFLSRGFGKDPWRCLTVALRWLTRQQGCSPAETKMLKWRLRHQLLRFAIADLRTADSVEPSDATVVRLAMGQLGHSAVRHHGIGASERAHNRVGSVASAHLQLAESAADELEDVLRSKPGRVELLPSLQLEAWGIPLPRCLHPLFDRLRRVQPDLGGPDPLPALLPVNFLDMPERLRTIGDVFECLRRCEDLCSRIANLHQAGKCKFGPFLCAALLEQVLTQMLPLPLGPHCATPMGGDRIWSPAGFDNTHPALTRSGQLDLLIILNRLGEHLAAAVSSLNTFREYDGVRCILSGVLAMLADRIIRIRVLHTDGPGFDEPMESELTIALRDGGFAVKCEAFLQQSETVELYAPELTIARTAILNYFSDVWESIQQEKRRAIFEWDKHAWMMWAKRETGTLALVSKLTRQRHYVSEPAALLAGVDPFALHSWPELQAYRDLIFWWKYFCCPDRSVLPSAPASSGYRPLDASLKWKVASEGEAYGSMPNRGPVFQVTALSKQHLLTTGNGTNRPEPPASGHRWPSEASPSLHTRPDRVSCEDDLLYLRCLPNFDNMLSQADSELLLSYLTVPLLRQPLILSFFCSRDRVSLLRSQSLQSLFTAALFEPGRLLLAPDAGKCPENVPADLGEERLLATSQGLLLAELTSGPAAMLGYVRNLLELSLVQDVGATSEMASVIRFAARTAARVQSHALWLLCAGPAEEDDGVGGLAPGSAEIAQLRHGLVELQKSFVTTLARFDAWVAELLAAAREDPKLEDANVRQCCNIHAHALLMLRNVGIQGAARLTADVVSRILTGMVFLTLRHTWNACLLEVPEPELFGVWQLHRRRIVHWLHAARTQPDSLDHALSSVHRAVAQLEGVGISADTDSLSWAPSCSAVPGRYRAIARGMVAPPEGAAEAAAASADEAGLGIEIDVQLLQVIVHGQHLQPLEFGLLADGDVQHILGGDQSDDDEEEQSSDLKRPSGTNISKSVIMQSSVVLNAEKVRVHELISRPFCLAQWAKFEGLPAIGEHFDRPYDPEELEEGEAWILPLFEPVRQRFFVAPHCGEQDIQFFLPSVPDDRAVFVCLAGMHPKIPGRVWKEVVLFRDWAVAHVYGIEGHAQQLYRALEYTTDCRRCYRGLQPSTSDRMFPLPAWAQHEAGSIAMQPTISHSSCVAISRTHVLAPSLFAGDREDEDIFGLDDNPAALLTGKQKKKKPNKEAGASKQKDNHDDVDDRFKIRKNPSLSGFPLPPSDSEASSASSSSSEQDEEEDDVKVQWGFEAYRKRSREGEQYIPPRLLLGLLPDALLEQYSFFQDNRHHRVLRGYHIESHSKAEKMHGAEEGARMNKAQPWLHVDLHGPWGPSGTCASVTWHPSLRMDDEPRGDRRFLAMLNLLYAPEGTPPHELARQLGRIEDLSHIIAWTSKEEEHSPHPTIERVELPRLQLTFQRRHGPGGHHRLYCSDYAGLFVPCGEPTAQLRCAAKLVNSIPHGLFLSNEEGELFCLVPFVCPHRPRIGVQPFGTQLVFERAGSWARCATRHFLFQVHPSLTMLKPPTATASLYLLWLQLAAREYGAAFDLAASVSGSGSHMSKDERQMFMHLGSLRDPHPDAHAVRVKVLLSSTESRAPFDLNMETAQYVLKRAHVSALCRLTEEEECTALQWCEDHRKRVAAVKAEVALMQNKPQFETFCKLLEDPRARFEASQQEGRALKDWIERIAAQFRALNVPALPEDVEELVLYVLSGRELPELFVVALENRRLYLTSEAPAALRIPTRPIESKWLLHVDRNALICTEGDLQARLLGHRAASVNTRAMLSSAGPELPDRFLSVDDALRLIPVFSAGERDLQEADLFLKLYGLFTRTTRLRLRRRATPQQQHTFARLLLALHPGSRAHGVLTSLLHILARNPQICPDMPKLTWPRRVRKVRQWRRFLQQIHEQVKVYEERRQLNWPRPETNRLPAWTTPIARQKPGNSRGALCPLVYGLAGDAACAGPFDHRCFSRKLEMSSIMECPPAVLDALASKPLADLARGMVEHGRATEVSEALPFNLSKHPGLQHPLARGTLARLQADAKEFAEMHREGGNTQLRGFLREDSERMASGPERRAAASAALRQLMDGLRELQASDLEFTVSGLQAAASAANAVDGSGEEAIKFRLLRRCGQETSINANHLCRQLLSATGKKGLLQLNPFVGADRAADALRLTSVAMLHSCRVQQVNVVLERLRGLQGALLGPFAPRPASLLQQAERVAADLDAQRSYIHNDRSYDPRLLHFEYIDRKLLRPRQVELVQSFLESLKEGRSAVQQMIMGNGKTTVVSPLLAFILADGSRLVALLVPPSLLSFSRTIISSAFHGAVSLRCVALSCDRAKILDVQLAARLQRALDLGEILVTCPGDVKALMLRLIENLLLAGDPRSSAQTRGGIGSETIMVGSSLRLLRSSVCLIDEVDLVLHPLRSELNFPVGPKELLPFHPHRWRLPLHILSCINQEDVPGILRENGSARAAFAAVRAAIQRGLESKQMQRWPHLVLLSGEFYHKELKGPIAEWLLTWLITERVGQGASSGADGSAEGTASIGADGLRAHLLSPTARDPGVRGRDGIMLNLGREWLQTLLPHCLSKIDRVTFGVMSDAQAAAQPPTCASTRKRLAIPFVGKDTPSPSSEYAHPDVLIGLTALAFHYEGLRRSDFNEALSRLSMEFIGEGGDVFERPAARRWKEWVEAAGGTVCLRQRELQDGPVSGTSASIAEGGAAGTQSGMPEGMASVVREVEQTRVLPLHLLERGNEAQMAIIFQLLRKLPQLVDWYLDGTVFPTFLRFQAAKLTASGQDIGGSLLFKQRIGFSGTPSELLPLELGTCQYERGSEGEVIATLSSPEVVQHQLLPEWTAKSLLDEICRGDFHALIDAGALITGLSNLQVAEYLLGLDSGPVHPVLRPEVEGLVFLDEESQKQILLRSTRSVQRLADCGLPVERRFTFYDHVHTTGTDVPHRADAVAVLTLGKDMTLRDYSQSAYRMRGIGRGQRLHLFVIPEVHELVVRQSSLGDDVPRTRSEAVLTSDGGRGLLRDILAWLVTNTFAAERIQHGMLQLQNACNVWRRDAFARILEGFHAPASDVVVEAVSIFRDRVDYAIPEGPPPPKDIVASVEIGLAQHRGFVTAEGEESVRAICRLLRGLNSEGHRAEHMDAEQEQEQEQEQEREQEKEKEQEVELENYVDLCHCREEDAPEPWPLVSLRPGGGGTGAGKDAEGSSFYPAASFRVANQRPLHTLSKNMLVSDNHFNRKWSALRRPKNVVFALEWVPNKRALNATFSVDPKGVRDEERALDAVLDAVWALAAGPGAATVPQELATDVLNLAYEPVQEWDAAGTSALLKLGAGAKVLGKQDLRSLLLHSHFRAVEEGRRFVLLSLQEAETIRRVLRCRKSLKAALPDTVLALRCVPAGFACVDASGGFQSAPTFQERQAYQLLRFLDGQSFYRAREVPFLIRALQKEPCMARRLFFESVAGLRRRPEAAGWREQPVARAFALSSEFEWLLNKVRAAWVGGALRQQGISSERCFELADRQRVGRLEVLEVLQLLHILGLRGVSPEDALDWLEAMCSGATGLLVSAEAFRDFVHSGSGLKIGISAATGTLSVDLPMPPEPDAAMVARCHAVAAAKIARRKREEAEAESVVHAAKEEAEQRIEDEQGANPLYRGREYALWDFRRARLPQGTLAFGHVCAVPEGKEGQHFLQVEPQGFVACPADGFLPNLLESYSITMFFRMPGLPKDASDACLIDTRRAGGGRILVSKEGSIYPAGHRSLPASSSSVARDVSRLAGVWSFGFDNVTKDARAMLRVSTDEAGRVFGGPLAAVSELLPTKKNPGSSAPEYKDTRLLRGFPVPTEFMETGHEFDLHCEVRVPAGSQQGWAGLLCRQGDARSGRDESTKKDKKAKDDKKKDKKDKRSASGDVKPWKNSGGDGCREGFCLGFNGDRSGTLRLDVGAERTCITLSSDVHVNDGKWHVVDAHVSRTVINLSVDGVTVSVTPNVSKNGELCSEAEGVALLIGDDPFGTNRKLQGELKDISMKVLVAQDDEDEDSPRVRPTTASNSKLRLDGRLREGNLQLRLGEGQEARTLVATWDGSDAFQGNWSTCHGHGGAGGTFIARRQHEEDVAGTWRLEQRTVTGSWEGLGTLSLCCFPEGEAVRVTGTLTPGSIIDGHSGILEGRLMASELELRLTSGDLWQGSPQLVGGVGSDALLEGCVKFDAGRPGGSVIQWRAVRTPEHSLTKATVPDDQEVQWHAASGLIAAPMSSFTSARLDLPICFGSWFFEMTIVEPSTTYSFGWERKCPRQNRSEVSCPSGHKGVHRTFVRNLSSKCKDKGCSRCGTKFADTAVVWHCSKCSWVSCMPCAGGLLDCKNGHGLCPKVAKRGGGPGGSMRDDDSDSDEEYRHGRRVKGRRRMALGRMNYNKQWCQICSKSSEEEGLPWYWCSGCEFQVCGECWVDGVRRAATQRALDSWTVDCDKDIRAGDIFGTEVNFTTRQAQFFLNGECFKSWSLSDVPKGAYLVPVVSLGPGGQALINTGHRPFMHRAPTTFSHGIIEALEIRPRWRVVLPADIEMLAAYVEPSTDSRGRPGLRSGQVIEELERLDAGWLRCSAGWIRTECLQPASLFAKDMPDKKQKGTDFGVDSQNLDGSKNLKFAVVQEGENHGAAGACSGDCDIEGSTVLPAMAVAAEPLPSDSFDVTFTVHSMEDPPEDGSNSTVWIGISRCPAPVQNASYSADDYDDEADYYDLEFQKNALTHCSDMLVMFHPSGYIVDYCGRHHSIGFPWRVGDFVRLVVKDGKLRCSLNGAALQKVEIDLSDFKDLYPAAMTSCGRLCVSASLDSRSYSIGDADVASVRPRVMGGRWHVLTMSCDVSTSSLDLWLDGERHSSYELPSQSMAMEPAMGLGIFGPRAGPGGRISELLGGQVRSVEISTHPASPEDVWETHAAKGVWRCREFSCGRSSGAAPRRNPAEATECLACGAPRVRSQTRPPGDRDPEHEGVIMVTADSFDELVMQDALPVLILAHTDWCGACQVMWPLWMKLAQLLEGSPIRVAAVNLSENDLPDAYFPELYVPVMKLFRKGETTEPVPYTGPPDLSALVAFIAANAGVSVESVITTAYQRYREARGIDALIKALFRIALEWRFSLDDDGDTFQSLCRFLYGRLLENDDDIQAIAASKPMTAGADISNIPQLTDHLLQAVERALMAAQPENPFLFIRDSVLLTLSSPRRMRPPIPRGSPGQRLCILFKAGIFAARLRQHRRRALCQFRFASNAGLRRRTVTLPDAFRRHDGIALLEALLMQGLPVDGLPEDSVAPLWMACHAGDLASVRLLLACNADIHKPFTSAGCVGVLPVEAAAAGGNARIVHLLLRRGSVPGAALHHAVWAGSAEVVELLLRLGLSATSRAHGLCPLDLAAVSGNAKCFGLLASSGCDMSLPLPSELCYATGLPEQSSPLHVAAALGYENLCRELSCRPDAERLLSQQNSAGQLPADVALLQLRSLLSPLCVLMWQQLAQRPQGPSVAKAVASAIRNKADPNEEGVNRWTALTAACAGGDNDAIQSLLTAGAQPSSGAGYVWARLAGATEAAAHLLAAGHVETAEDRTAFDRLRDAGLASEAKRPMKRCDSNATTGSKNKSVETAWVLPPGAVHEGFRQAPDEGYTAAWSSLGSCMRAGLGLPGSTKGVTPVDLGTLEAAQNMLKSTDQAVRARPGCNNTEAECALRTLQAVIDGCKLSPEVVFLMATGLEGAVFPSLCESPSCALAEQLQAALKELPTLRQTKPLFRGVTLGRGVSLNDFLRGASEVAGDTVQASAPAYLPGRRYEPGHVVKWPATALLTGDPRAAVCAMRACGEAALEAAAGERRGWFSVLSGLAGGRNASDAAGECRVLFVLRRCRSAREVTMFSPRGLEHAREALLPPSSLRVVALKPLTDALLAPEAFRPSWVLPPPALDSMSLTIDEAARLHEVIVVLDEDDVGEGEDQSPSPFTVSTSASA